MHQPGETYDDIREAVGKLCAQFPGSYWRALDREMAYPAAFVQALTEAGWLGALIPEDSSDIWHFWTWAWFDCILKFDRLPKFLHHMGSAFASQPIEKEL